MSKDRVVVCAANRYKSTIIVSARHFDGGMHRQIAQLADGLKPPSSGAWDQGFIDQYGVYMDRKEAHKVASAAGQIKHRCGGDDNKLFSENLY